MSKTIEDHVEEVAAKKAAMADQIIRNMLRKLLLPIDPQALEQAGYVLVIERHDNVTRYKLAKIVDMHTLTETIKEKANGDYSIMLDVDVKKEILA